MLTNVRKHSSVFVFVYALHKVYANKLSYYTLR